MARIWLHIGMMKTGTTAMQAWFAAGEEALLRQRLLYVRVRPNLPACGPLADALARGAPEGVAMIARIRDRIESAAPQDVLISAESFSVHDPLVAQKLAAEFPEHEVNVLVWLRRQDRYAEAVYKQSVKWNGETGDLQAVLDHYGDHLDYERLLDRWQATLPRARLLPQVYDEGVGQGRPDSIRAMLVAIGRADLVPPGSADFRQNVTPSAALISHYNSIPRKKARDVRRANRQLMQEFGEAASGRGDLLLPDQVRAILARYAESNRRVRERWFPDREVLFGDDVPAESATGDLARMLGRFDELFLGQRKRP